MGKMQIQNKISFWEDEYDDQEKEVYLKELGGAVQNYIKTGIENKQLDDMIILEKQFQEKYKQRFDVGEIVNNLFDINSENIQKLEFEDLLSAEELEENQFSDIRCALDNVMHDFSDDVVQMMKECISRSLAEIKEAALKHARRKMEEVLKDAAYLSHINMLYELYEEEKKLRKQQKEFEQISKHYQNMAVLARKLSEYKRVEIEEVEEKVGISQDEFVKILNGCKKYFNIRNRKDGIQVSLSPIGRKYTEYTFYYDSKYTDAVLNQIVYTNCDRLLTSLKNSCNKGVVYEVKLKGLMPDNERVIKHMFHNVLYEVMSEKEDMYPKINFCITEPEESEDSDEENRIRIPEVWGRNIYWID